MYRGQQLGSDLCFLDSGPIIIRIMRRRRRRRRRGGGEEEEDAF